LFGVSEFNIEQGTPNNDLRSILHIEEFKGLGFFSQHLGCIYRIQNYLQTLNVFIMLIRKLIIGSLTVLILLSASVACSASKDIEERKNLMMPKKSEMSRNSRYREVEKRKINKIKTRSSKNKKLF
jgi:hypothetical protein